MFRYGRPFLFSSSPSIIIPFQSFLPSQIHPLLQFLVISHSSPFHPSLFSVSFFLHHFFSVLCYPAFFLLLFLFLPPPFAFYIHPLYSPPPPPPRVFFLVLISYSGWTNIHHRVIRRRSILSSPVHFSLPSFVSSSHYLSLISLFFVLNFLRWRFLLSLAIFINCSPCLCRQHLVKVHEYVRVCVFVLLKVGWYPLFIVDVSG